MGPSLEEYATLVRLSGYAPRLPANLRVLLITGSASTGARLARSLIVERAVDLWLEEAVGAAAGMSRLRSEAFDVVLVGHQPGELDALEVVEAVRGSGGEEAVIVLGLDSRAELEPLALEAGADAYLPAAQTATRALVWCMARAVELQQLRRAQRRFQQADEQRLRLEHEEAERLLAEQRSLLNDLEAIYDPSTTGALVAGANDDNTTDHAQKSKLSAAITRRASGTLGADLPTALVHQYRELLRSYIIMGSGNLSQELSALGNLLASAEISAPQAIELHLCALEELVRGRGGRSARHVVTRADQLVVELMVHLTEGYRQRCQRETPSTPATASAPLASRDFNLDVPWLADAA